MNINNLIIYLFYISFKITFSYNEKNNDNYYNSKAGLIVSLIISIIISIIIIILILYCCCRITTNSLLNNNNQINRRNNIHSNPINSLNNNNIYNRQYFQTYNINSERLYLNSNEKTLIIAQQHFLFQNIMKPEIFSERFKLGEKNCPICLIDFIIGKSKICMTNCHHIFHFYCLKKYVINKKGKKCPICNNNFFEIFENIKINEKKIKIIPLNEKDNPLNQK